MSFRGQQGITRCHFMFFTIVLRRPTIWQVYERTTNSIDPLTISSFTFFERILPEVVFVVYSSFVPISEKKICFWSGATWVPNGHWQVLNGSIPEAVICSNKPTGGQRQSSYSSKAEKRAGGALQKKSTRFGHFGGFVLDFPMFIYW